MNSRIFLSPSRAGSHITAACTAVIFLTASFSAPRFAAADVQKTSLETQGGSEGLQKPGIFQATSATTVPETITVPPESGFITFRRRGSGPLLIHIQDAHAAPEAQQAIQDLVTGLAKRYGISRVYLEGAEGRLDPLLFQNFPDPRILRETLDRYLDRAELSGGASASAFLRNTEFYGIEDWKVYQEALAAFQKADPGRELWQARFASLRKELDGLKQKIYSKPAAKFDEVARAWASQDFEAGRFFEGLSQLAGPRQLRAYPWVAALGQELEPPSADLETGRRLLKELIARIDRRPMESPAKRSWNQKKQAWSTGQIGFSEMSHQALQTALKAGVVIPPHALATLRKSAGVYEKLASLQGGAMTAEIEALLEALRTQSLKTPAEKRLDDAGRSLGFLEKLIRFELTGRDWEDFVRGSSGLRAPQEGRDSLGGPVLNPGNRDPEAAQVEEAAKLFGRIGATWHLFETGEAGRAYFRFYELADRRSEIFARNIAKEMKAASIQAAIVITGGFHSGALRRRFSDPGCSYIEIQPAVKSLPESRCYVELMRGEVSWKSYFRERDGEVSLYEAFAQAASDRLTQALRAEDRVPVIRTWRDEILRTLAREGRLESARDYTRFIDGSIRALDPPAAASLRIRWQARLEKFLRSVRAMDRRHELNGTNLRHLLRQGATVPAICVASLKPGLRVSLPRSEVRAGSSGAGGAALALPPTVLHTSDSLEQVIQEILRLEDSRVFNAPRDEKGQPVYDTNAFRPLQLRFARAFTAAAIQADRVQFGETPGVLAREMIRNSTRLSDPWFLELAQKDLFFILDLVHRTQRTMSVLSHEGEDPPLVIPPLDPQVSEKVRRELGEALTAFRSEHLQLNANSQAALSDDPFPFPGTFNFQIPERFHIAWLRLCQGMQPVIRSQAEFARILALHEVISLNYVPGDAERHEPPSLSMRVKKPVRIRDLPELGESFRKNYELRFSGDVPDEITELRIAILRSPFQGPRMGQAVPLLDHRGEKLLEIARKRFDSMTPQQKKETVKQIFDLALAGRCLVMIRLGESSFLPLSVPAGPGSEMVGRLVGRDPAEQDAIARHYRIRSLRVQPKPDAASQDAGALQREFEASYHPAYLQMAGWGLLPSNVTEEYVRRRRLLSELTSGLPVLLPVFAMLMASRDGQWLLLPKAADAYADELKKYSRLLQEVDPRIGEAALSGKSEYALRQTDFLTALNRAVIRALVNRLPQELLQTNRGAFERAESAALAGYGRIRNELLRNVNKAYHENLARLQEEVGDGENEIEKMLGTDLISGDALQQLDRLMTRFEEERRIYEQASRTDEVPAASVRLDSSKVFLEDAQALFRQCVYDPEAPLSPQAAETVQLFRDLAGLRQRLRETQNGQRPVKEQILKMWALNPQPRVRAAVILTRAGYFRLAVDLLGRFLKSAIDPSHPKAAKFQKQWLEAMLKNDDMALTRADDLPGMDPALNDFSEARKAYYDALWKSRGTSAKSAIKAIEEMSPGLSGFLHRNRSVSNWNQGPAEAVVERLIQVHEAAKGTPVAILASLAEVKSYLAEDRAALVRGNPKEYDADLLNRSAQTWEETLGMAEDYLRLMGEHGSEMPEEYRRLILDQIRGLIPELRDFIERIRAEALQRAEYIFTRLGGDSQDRVAHCTQLFSGLPGPFRPSRVQGFDLAYSDPPASSEEAPFENRLQDLEKAITNLELRFPLQPSPDRDAGSRLSENPSHAEMPPEKGPRSELRLSEQTGYEKVRASLDEAEKKELESVLREAAKAVFPSVLWTRSDGHIDLLKLGGLVSCLKEALDPARSNILDPYRRWYNKMHRRSERIPPAIGLMGSQILERWPSEMRPMSPPERIVFINGSSGQMILTLNGSAAHSGTLLADGPVAFLPFKDESKYFQAAPSEMQRAVVLASREHGSRQGPSFLCGAQATVAARPRHDKAEVFKELIPALALAGEVPKEFKMAAGTNLSERDMEAILLRMLETSIDQKFRRVSQASWWSTQFTLRWRWFFYRWIWLPLFSKGLIKDLPRFIELPPVVGVPGRFCGFSRMEALVEGASVLAALLAVVRHPWFLEGHSDSEAVTLRGTVWGCGNVAWQFLEALSRRSMPERIHIVGLAHPDTPRDSLYREVTSLAGLAPEVLQEIRRRIRAGENPLRDIRQSVPGQASGRLQEVPPGDARGGRIFEEADFIILALAPGSFDAAQAKKVPPAGAGRRKIIIEAIYQCATPEARILLEEKGVLFIPRSSVNVGVAIESMQEMLGYLFPGQGHAERFQVIDAIENYISVTIRSHLDALRSGIFHGMDVGRRAEEINQAFSRTVEDIVEWFYDKTQPLIAYDSALRESGDPVSGRVERDRWLRQFQERELGRHLKTISDEGVHERLRNIGLRLADLCGQDMPYRAAIRLAIHEQMYGEYVSGVSWEGRQVSQIQEAVHALTEELLEDLNPKTPDNLNPADVYLQRAAAYRLGQIPLTDGDRPRVVERLGQILNSPRQCDYQVRANAASALGRIRHEAAHPYLLSSLANPQEDDPKVVQMVEFALRQYTAESPMDAAARHIPAIDWPGELAKAQDEIDQNLQRARDAEAGLRTPPETWSSDYRGQRQEAYRKLGMGHYRRAIFLLLLRRMKEAEREFRMAVANFKKGQTEGNQMPVRVQLFLARGLWSMKHLDQARRELAVLLVTHQLNRLFDPSGSVRQEIGEDFFMDICRTEALRQMFVVEGEEPERAAELASNLFFFQFHFATRSSQEGGYLYRRRHFMMALKFLSEAGGRLSGEAEQDRPFKIEVINRARQALPNGNAISEVARILKEVPRDRKVTLRDLAVERLVRDFQESNERRGLWSDSIYRPLDPYYQILVLLASEVFCSDPEMEERLLKLFSERRPPSPYVSVMETPLSHRVRALWKMLQVPVSPRWQNGRALSSILRTTSTPAPQARAELRLNPWGLGRKDLGARALNLRKLALEKSLLEILVGIRREDPSVTRGWLRRYRRDPAASRHNLCLAFSRLTRPLQGKWSRVNWRGALEAHYRFRRSHPDFLEKLRLKAAISWEQLEAAAAERGGDFSIALSPGRDFSVRPWLEGYLKRMGALHAKNSQVKAVAGLWLDPRSAEAAEFLASLRPLEIPGAVEIQVWDSSQAGSTAQRNAFLDLHRNAFFFSGDGREARSLVRREQFLDLGQVLFEEALPFVTEQMLPVTARAPALTPELLRQIRDAHHNFLSLDQGHLLLSASLREWILTSESQRHTSISA